MWMRRWVWMGVVAISLSAARGWAQEKCRADAPVQRWRGSVLELSGWVTLRCEGLVVQAQWVRIDQVRRELVAEGDVTLVQGDLHLTGQRLELDLNTRTGVLYEAFAFDTPHTFARASWVRREGEEVYRLAGAEVTECHNRNPHWSLKAHRVKLKLNDYIRLTHVVIRIQSVPVFYLPWLQIPIKRERTTGFLFPRMGPNSQKGFFIEQAFFWAIRRNQDLTLTAQWYARRGTGLRAEYRYIWSERNRGQLAAIYFRDATLGHQWTLRWDHSVRWGRFGVGTLYVDWFSSADFLRSFGDTFTRRSQVHRLARAFLNTRWGIWNLSMQAEAQDAFLPAGRRRLVARLPLLQASVYGHAVGPLFMTTRISYQHWVQRQSNFRLNLHRLDLFHQWSLPWNRLRWLSITPSIQFQGIVDSHRRSRATGAVESILFPQGSVVAQVQTVGPVFYRIFDWGTLRAKHTIEPFVQYLWGTGWTPAEARSVIGTRVLGAQHRIVYGVTHRLFVRTADPTASPREWIAWSVDHSMLLPGATARRPGEPVYGPVRSTLRISPMPTFQVDAGLMIHPRRWILTASNLSASWRHRSGAAFFLEWRLHRNVRFRKGTPILSPARQQIRFNLTTPPRRRFQLQLSGAYDVTRRQWFSARGGLIWNEDCFSLGIQVVRYQLGPRPEFQFHFSLSIPKVGNLLNFSPGLGGLYGGL